MSFEVEEVGDVRAAWPELEPLLLGILQYHEPFDARPLRPDWAERWREYLATRDDGLFLVARSSEGDAVGFLDGRISRDRGIFDEVAGYISDAFVLPEQRFRGVGSALLARFEAWCSRQGATAIRLDVSAGNALGQRFWSKAGFEPERHVMLKTLEERS